MSSTSTTWSSQGNTKAGATVSSTDSLTTGTLTADTIQLASNIIKASDGGTTITLDTSDNVTIAGGLTASGTTQLNGTLTVGVNDTGYDVQFYGDTASNYMLWDTSQDKLIINSSGNAGNLELVSTDTDAETGPGINLTRQAAGADNDSIGMLNFYGQDGGGNSTLYSRVYSQILEADDGNEQGSLHLGVMTESGSGNALKTGLWIKGTNTNDTVDCFMNNGSLTIGNDLTVTGGDIILGADADGTDRSVVFGHSTLKTIMGIDDSNDAFVINTDASFDGTLPNNSFTIDASHNVGIAGDLTVYGSDITFGNGAVIDNSSNAAVLAFTTEASYNFKSTSGNDLSVSFFADAGEDNSDKWNFKFLDGGDFKIQSFATGSYVAGLTLTNTGNLTVAGDLTVSGGDIDLSGEAAAINLIDNNSTAITFGSTGNTDVVTINTADGQETFILDGDRGNTGVAQGCLTAKGTGTISGSPGDNSNLGGIYLKEPTFVNTSGTNTLARHNYIKIDDVNITNSSGSISITDVCLFELENNLGTSNSCTTNSDKTGNSKTGTIKINVNGTIHHIQLYAN